MAASFDFVKLKAQTRRIVHDKLAVEAWYSDSVDTDEQSLRARCHNKQTLVGELNDEGYAQTFDSIDRLIFIPSDHEHIVLRKNGRVRFPSLNDQTFVLVTVERVSGPLEQIWQVVPA